MARIIKMMPATELQTAITAFSRLLLLLPDEDPPGPGPEDEKGLVMRVTGKFGTVRFAS